MEARANPLSGRLIVGIALMTLGALWTLDNLDILESEHIVRWWPLVPLAIGLMKLTGVGMEKQTAFGAFLTIVGGLFLMDQFHVLSLDFSIIWPLLFIFMGVQLTMRAMGGSRAAGPAPGQPDADDYVRSFAVMGGITRRNESQAFRGGELTAVMGGVELDLTDAVPAGGRAVVDVFAIWGGIEIRVPDDWRVEIDATPVMAGVESSARLAPGLVSAGTLVVRGFVMMGGVDIKNGPLGEKRVGAIVRTRRGRGDEPGPTESR
jgi:predicted membrane protein